MEAGMPGVDLSINAAALADTYEHMRIWLDHQGCIPVDFDQLSSETGTITIHVEFENEVLADAFQREFVGSKLIGLRRRERKHWLRFRP
jgi:hypothetical protein